MELDKPRRWSALLVILAVNLASCVNTEPLTTAVETKRTQEGLPTASGGGGGGTTTTPTGTPTAGPGEPAKIARISTSNQIRAYHLGESISLSLEFNKRVVINNGTPSLTLLVATGKTVSINAVGFAPGPVEILNFSYQVGAEDQIDALKVIGTNLASLGITAADGSGALIPSLPAAGLTSAATLSSAVIPVDGIAPRVDFVDGGDASASYLTSGSTIQLRVFFSEKVIVAASPLPKLTLALTTGGDRQVTCSSTTEIYGVTVLLCNYAILANDVAPLLNYKDASSLATQVTDLAGNVASSTAGTLRLPALDSGKTLADNTPIAVDASPARIINLSNDPVLAAIPVQQKTFTWDCSKGAGQCQYQAFLSENETEEASAFEGKTIQSYNSGCPSGSTACYSYSPNPLNPAEQFNGKKFWLHVRPHFNGSPSTISHALAVFDNTKPVAPASVAMSKPATNLGSEPSPEILVDMGAGQLLPGETVTLYKGAVGNTALASACTASTAWGSATVGGTEPVSTLKVTANALSSGDAVVFYAGVSDQAGNKICAGAGVNVAYTLDASAPVVRWLDGTGDTTRTRSQTWRWTCDTSQPPCTYRVSLALDDVTQDPSGEYSIAEADASKTQPDGNAAYTLKVQAKNALGKESVVLTSTVVLDNFQPNITGSMTLGNMSSTWVTKISDEVGYLGTRAKPTVNIQVNDEVSVGDRLRVGLYTSPTCANDKRVGYTDITAAGAIQVTPASDLPDEAYEFHAKVEDLAGNESPCSVDKVKYQYSGIPVLQLKAMYKGVTVDPLVAVPGVQWQWSCPRSLDWCDGYRAIDDDDATEIIPTDPNNKAKNKNFFVNPPPTGFTATNTSVSYSPGAQGAQTRCIHVQAKNKIDRVSTVYTSCVKLDTRFSVPPDAVDLILPAGGVSAGQLRKPTLRIGGVEPGETVYLYSDEICATPSVADGVVGAGASTINLTPREDLAEGEYVFAARRKNALGLISDCSSKNASYAVDLTPPAHIQIGKVVPVQPTSAETWWNGSTGPLAYTTTTLTATWRNSASLDASSQTVQLYPTANCTGTAIGSAQTVAFSRGDYAWAVFNAGNGYTISPATTYSFKVATKDLADNVQESCSGVLGSATGGTIAVASSSFTRRWTFGSSDASKYGYDSNLIEFSNSLVRLKPVDQSDDDNSTSGFGGGTLTGLVWDGASGALKLDETVGTNTAAMDSSWAPQWATLAGYWKFNSGTLGLINADASIPAAKGSDAVAKTGAMSYVAGKVNQGIRFTGTDYVETNTAAGVASTTFTLMAWVKVTKTIDAFITSPAVFGSYDGTNGKTFAINTAGKPYINNCVSGACTSLASTGTVQTQRWTHLAVSVNGGTGTFYIDGAAAGTTAAAAVSSINGTSWKLGGNASNQKLEGNIDEPAIWTAALSAAEIAHVYSRQAPGYSGTFVSRPMNALATAQRWKSLAWTTPLPFGKPLPDSSGSIQNELAADYSGIFSESLMTDIAGLWHLDEASGTSGANSILDRSGNGYNATPTTISFGGAGVLGGSAQFQGASKILTAAGPTLGNQDFTISAWVRKTRNGQEQSIVSQGVSSGGNGMYLKFNAQDKLVFGFFWDDAESTNTFTDQNWHHVVGIFRKADQSLVAYVDGKEEIRGAATDPYSGSGALCFGGLFSVCSSGLLTGHLDEVAIWKRALDPAEVTQLYRRGAARVKFQYRSCANADCSSATTWTGPDNTSKTYFSELHNMAAGLIKPAAPNVSFSTFGLSPASQWFQYRAILESEALGTAGNPIGPELKSVTIGPVHYDSGNPAIYSVLGQGQQFKTLSSFAESLGVNGCTGIKYAVSLDTVTWYYYTGTNTWSVTNEPTPTYANTAAQLSSGLSKFHDPANGGVNAGTIYIKAFMTSDGEKACEISELSISGNLP